MTTRQGWMRRLLLAAGCGVVPAIVGAQGATTTLVGSVRDSAGRALGGVELRLNGGDVAARSDDLGGFRIGVVPSGPTRVDVRRLGFAPSALTVTLRPGRIDSLVVTLNAVATALPGVVVEDEAMTRSKQLLAGFWERRSRGFGSFVTREEIAQRNTSHFVDLVRRINSTSIVNLNGRQTIRFKRSQNSRDCPPQYWLDGMRIESATPDEFNPEDIEAIEVYAGLATIPVQFAPKFNAYTCGAIVIWTRLPGT
jgi:hypothetical protein